jgi:hypothetical protein
LDVMGCWPKTLELIRDFQKIIESIQM